MASAIPAVEMRLTSYFMDFPSTPGYPLRRESAKRAALSRLDRRLPFPIADRPKNLSVTSANKPSQKLIPIVRHLKDTGFNGVHRVWLLDHDIMLLSLGVVQTRLDNYVHQRSVAELRQGIVSRKCKRRSADL
jgi:hypothetical protein